jgi:hypothetical protein
MATIQPIAEISGYVTKRCIEILFPDKGICLRTFKTYQLSGRIPYLKLGTRVLFNPSEVKAALRR